jgi:hypothetical protein
MQVTKHGLPLVGQSGGASFAYVPEMWLMEFYCVLSVGGSLVTYQVQKTDELTYRAVLRTPNSRRDHVAAEIILQKKEGIWQSQPPDTEVGPGLINAIETGGGPK